MPIKHAGARLISRNAAAGFSARRAHSTGIKHAQGLTRALIKYHREHQSRLTLLPAIAPLAPIRGGVNGKVKHSRKEVTPFTWRESGARVFQLFLEQPRTSCAGKTDETRRDAYLTRQENR